MDDLGNRREELLGEVLVVEGRLRGGTAPRLTPGRRGKPGK